MTYLIVGVDRQTLAPWHGNVGASDASTAARVALERAQARGIDLVVAAVIGPSSSVVSIPAGERASSAWAA